MGSDSSNTPRTCLVQPRLGVLTETFIEAHARHLPRPLVRLDCDPYPNHDEGGRPLAVLGRVASMAR